MGDNYHHGNLRQALIDAGIKIINEQGEQVLSLRKVAAACGVSHAAPYAHFADKESLLAAIREQVTARFMEELQRAFDCYKTESAERCVIEMGKRYILFFKENPDYFTFLFYRQKIQVHFATDKDYEGDYAPYLLMKHVFMWYCEEKKLSFTPEQMERELIKLWGSVQGIASIVCMENVSTVTPWEEIIEEIIR